MQIIIDTTNTSISVKNKCFFIQNQTVQRQISPKRISSIAITTNCTLNTAAIKLAANHQVPILFFNNFGTIQARLWSPYFVNIANLRKKQLYFSSSVLATDWVISILQKKTKAQLTNLRRLARKKIRFAEKVNKVEQQIDEIINKTNLIQDTKIAKVRNTIMGYEGSISRHYFQALNLFLPEEFRFAKRSRRPAQDFFNAGLNYLYGMTYSVVESGVYAKGLDPFIGFLHADQYKKPTLVFDLIEPIRPVVDGILLNLIMKNELNPDHFIKKQQGYWVSKAGKRVIISSFNNFLYKRVELDGSVKRLKDHIYQESNQLGNLISEKINQE